MDVQFTVTIGGKLFNSVERGLDELAEKLESSLDNATPRVSRALLVSLRRVYGKMEKRHSDPWRPGRSRATKLFQRTGGGLRDILESIRVNRAAGTLSEVEGRIGAFSHMTVQEEGATIRATKSKYLTIPLPAAMDSRGVPLRERARDWDNTFVARSRKGNLLIFQRRGREVVPLYLLKSQVTIRPRLGLGRAVKSELPYFEERALEILIEELGL